MDYEAVKYVEGFVDNIIFRNEDNGYTVFNIIYKGEEVTCVGVLSYINAGEFITATGEFVKHAIYYMQFSIKTYEFKTPEDAKSVKRYLASGAVKGIGEKMADRIVSTFGDDTFRIMEEEPERLAEIKGISMAKAMDIAAQLNDKQDMRKAMMFLQKYGINMNLSNKIFKQYGNRIYTIIEQNPYKLADDIDGVGFKTADEIAVKVGIKVDSEFRIKSGIFYIALSDDAIFLSNKFNFKLTNLNNSIVKCGFPISSIDKYIKKFKINNINFKLVDSSTNLIYSPNDYQLDCRIRKIIDSIISIDINALSVSEAYKFIESLQKELNKINL